MPWKNFSSVSVREDFVLRSFHGAQPFAQLCRDCGISRKTGYKWLARYRSGGRDAMGEASRRPKHFARQKSPRWKQRVAQARRARPHWGPKKLRAVLRNLYPRAGLPSVRTIGRWLQQLGLTKRQMHRARRGPRLPHPGLTQPRHLHQVWTVDFKGWLRTADGRRQEPLTVREAHSRYLLDIRILADQSDRGVRRAMTRLFRREGLPEAIRVDNGSPFASGRGPLGLSVLSVWWLRLGIRVEFTRRARPGDNAAHEQLHACYKAEVLQNPAANRSLLQRRTERWRMDYNQRRPHEALAQHTPAQGYRSSSRRMPPVLPAWHHPQEAELRRVSAKGDIRWRGRTRGIGRAFAGQRIALVPLSPKHHAVQLGDLLIGELHLKDPGAMRPAQWSRLPQTPLKV